MRCPNCGVELLKPINRAGPVLKKILTDLPHGEFTAIRFAGLGTNKQIYNALNYAVRRGLLTQVAYGRWKAASRAKSAHDATATGEAIRSTGERMTPTQPDEAG